MWARVSSVAAVHPQASKSPWSAGGDSSRCHPGVTAEPASSPLSVRTRGMDTELVTKQGDVLGAGPLADVPAGWHAAVAAAGGQLIVVYGCAIGVRPPAPGKPFPAVARRRELAHSQTGNLAAWGLAGWR